MFEAGWVIKNEGVCVHDQETHTCVCCRGETGETYILELKMMMMMMMMMCLGAFEKKIAKIA